MHFSRTILVGLAIVLVALAQQVCCCVIAPGVHSLIRTVSPIDSADTHVDCCHHAPPAHQPPDGSEGDNPIPLDHECDCKVGRIMPPSQSGDLIPKPLYCQTMAFPATLPPGSGTGPASALDLLAKGAGGWEQGRGCARGAPMLPLRQGVLLTI